MKWKRKKFIEKSQHDSCESKCLLKSSSAPALQQLHICHFSRPSKYFKNESDGNFIKQMTQNSRRFVTGEKLKFMDRFEAAFGVSIHLLLLCVAVLQKPTGCTKLNFIYNHRMIQGSIQFYLSFVFFSPPI